MSWTLVRRDICSRMDLLYRYSTRDPRRRCEGERTTVDASDASAVTDPEVDRVRTST